jgi:1,4-alpha-glucan branching enzyme
MQEIQMVILGLLADRDLYGYQIVRSFSRGSYPWSPAPQSVVEDALSTLLARGLVSEPGGQARGLKLSRILFEITETGRSALREALTEAWEGVDVGTGGLPLALALSAGLPTSELERILRHRADRLEQLREQTAQIRDEWLASEDAPPGGPRLLHRLVARLEDDIVWTRELVAAVQQEGAQATLPIGRPKVAPGVVGDAVGAFTFVLHSHLPYCRMAGRWPHGEEWLHEAAAETYVPLLDVLYDLRDDGVPFRLTVSLTPVLTEQLADPLVREHFVAYLDEEIQAAASDIPRFGEQGEKHLEYLAGFYGEYYERVRHAFVDRFQGDVVGAFRRLQDDGYIEIITSAATHGYLPLLSRDASIYGQLKAGIASYRRHFGRAPRAIWLPECAYRPAYMDDDGTIRPGLEEFLAAQGITCFFVETHAIVGGRPVGKAAGDVAIGLYGAVERNYVLSVSELPATDGTTYEAYYVVGGEKGLTSPPVAAIGRNDRTGQQVWSADWGYPGEADYREFHRKDPESGLQYWRVTGPGVDLGAKDLYHPDWAEGKVRAHADHYAQLVEDLLLEHRDDGDGFPLIASNYDAELFGHWWFEGVEWIGEVLRRLAASSVVELTTASDYLADHEPERLMAIPESSWGSGGNHWTWNNPQTDWVWEPIHEAEVRMERLVALYPKANGALRSVLNQAARELLLLQSSDWPFLITTGQAGEYATLRFSQHLERFSRLAADAEAYGPSVDPRHADECYAYDNVFPDIDYRWFAERQGRAE